MKPLIIKLIALMSVFAIGVSINECEFRYEESDNGIEKTVNLNQVVYAYDNKAYSVKMNNVWLAATLVIGDKEYVYSGEGDGYIIVAELEVTAPLELFAPDRIYASFHVETKEELIAPPGEYAIATSYLSVDEREDLFEELNGEARTAADGQKDTSDEEQSSRIIFLPFEISAEKIECCVKKDALYVKYHFGVRTNDFCVMSKHGNPIPVVFRAKNIKPKQIVNLNI